VFVGVIGTAFAYVASIAASEMLGSRLMSFVGLLEVVFASIFAWVLLGEALTITQLLGGVAILAGIALVRSEKQADAPLEPGSVDESAEPSGVADEVTSEARSELTRAAPASPVS
jgi:hypothetical protein